MELTFQGQNWSDNKYPAQVCYPLLLGALQKDQVELFCCFCVKSMPPKLIFSLL